MNDGLATPSPGVSIMHFEDQYMDMASLVHQLFLMITSNIMAQDSNAIISKNLTENQEGLRIYEIITNSKVNSFPVVRYILTDSERITDRLKNLLLERRLFVLDAWRETDGGTKLRCNVNETFQSINGYYSSLSDVVIFSAYPGNSDRINGRKVPLELTKSSPEDLQIHLTDHILKYLNS